MYVTVRGTRPARAGSTATGRRAVSATVILLGLTSLFTDISSEMVVAVLPLFATSQLALSPIAFGIIDGIYQGVSTLVRVGGGLTADLTGRPKAVAVAGYGLSAGAKLALLPVSSGVALGAVVATDRVGKGIRTAPRDALIAASTPLAGLGNAFGVHRALDTTGALAGPIIAFALLAAIPNGFDSVFLVSFAAAVIGLAILVLLVPNLRTIPAEGQRPNVRQVVRLAVEPRMRRLLLVAGLLSTLTIGDGFLYLALQRREDFAVKYFPLLFAGTAVTYLALAIPFGRLADRYGRMAVFLAGHLALVCAYAFAFGVTTGVASVLGCLALLGIYYAATDGVLAAAAAAVSPAHLRGSGIALAQTMVAAGKLLAGIAFGAAWSWYGRDAALAGFAVILALSLPAAALLLRGART
ncbi:MAG: MFS transporter [Actinomycetes bacterium]|jgi:MFS family permease